MRLVITVVVGSLMASPLVGQVRQQFGVMVPMRDGARLATDLWMPAAPGRHPVVLIRTPYLRATTRADIPAMGQYFASRGYVLAVQDVRGRGDSDGEFNFFFQEGPDGFDAIEWLARQSYANGRVGMMGLSYLGTVQWLAAREHPPALACIAPTAAAGQYLDELPYQGGAFLHQWALHWLFDLSGRISQAPNLTATDWDAVYAHRPLMTADSVLGRPMRLYREFLANPVMNDYWRRIQFRAEDFSGITIPTLTTTGWFDGDQLGALFYWRHLMAHAPDQRQHYLLIGPWTHVQTFLGGSTRMGELVFSPDAVVDNMAIHVAFFDWCLKQSSSRFDAPRAKVYLTGANQWLSLDAYPPPAAVPTSFYLSSRGRANSVFGDGALSTTPPISEPPDRFTYDPKDPVPSALDGGEDRTALARRDDILVYTSDPLAAAIDVVGSVVVNVEAATDGKDTDFTANLVDVHPDGKAIKLGPAFGVRRGRYRHGPEREELMTPGKPERFRIELYDIAHRFLPRHRIRVEITSSAAPLLNPNQNTGNPVATDTTWRVAHQTVYHDKDRPSALVLPVVPAPNRP